MIPQKCLILLDLVLLLFLLKKHTFETLNRKTNTENLNCILFALYIQFMHNLSRKNNIIKSHRQEFLTQITKFQFKWLKFKLDKSNAECINSFFWCWHLFLWVVFLISILRILSKEDEDEVMLSVVTVYCIPNTCMQWALVGVDF